MHSEKFLKRLGADSKTLKKLLAQKPKKLTVENQLTRPHGNIDSNGTKPIHAVGQYFSHTHVIAPVCNKGAYQLVSVQDMHTMGKKT